MKHGFCSGEGKLKARRLPTDLKKCESKGTGCQDKAECRRPRIKGLKEYEYEG